jgi:hypothetical protein
MFEAPIPAVQVYFLSDKHSLIFSFFSAAAAFPARPVRRVGYFLCYCKK